MIGEQNEIIIRPAKDSEWEQAMALSWQVFLQFEASDYTEEGISHFEAFISDKMLHDMFRRNQYMLLVACDKDKIVGLVSLRDRNHISLLFVDGQYHRRGIGRRLIWEIVSRVPKELYRVTVNAAPYAVDFYHKVGFVDTGLEKSTTGIRYTPMELYL